jgi:hypothetical protein
VIREVLGKCWALNHEQNASWLRAPIAHPFGFSGEGKVRKVVTLAKLKSNRILTTLPGIIELQAFPEPQHGPAHDGVRLIIVSGVSTEEFKFQGGRFESGLTGQLFLYQIAQ